MAKPTGPLLAFRASGTIAKTQVYATWRGRSYVRQHVIPHNPRSSGQLQTREVFSWLQATWKGAPADVQDPWTLFTQGRPLTNRNAFSSVNVKALRTATVLDALVLCNGAKGGLAPAAMTATPGATQLTVALTAPSLPSGWTIIKGVAAAIRDQDPHSGLLYTITAGEDLTTPYSIVLTGLTSGQVYQVRGYFAFSKVGSATVIDAWGAELATQATPT